MIKFPHIIISEQREGRYREIPMYPILATAIQFLIDLPEETAPCRSLTIALR